MNTDKTLFVSTSLKLPLKMVQDFSMNQVQAIYELLHNPISRLVDVATKGISNIRERFRKEDITGGIGREIPYNVFESVMKLESASLSQLNAQERQLLLIALCRYPETKIINAQLFLHILSYYQQHLLSPTDHHSHDVIDFNNAILHAKTFYPDIVYVFDLLNIRLASVIKGTSTINKTIRKEDLLDLFARVDIRLGRSEMMKLLDFLSYIHIYDAPTEHIDMKAFMQFISYFTRSAIKEPVIESERNQSLTTYPYNPRVYSHILNRLHNNADLVLSRIRVYNHSHPDYVSKNIFSKALQDSGIVLTENDMAGLWHYMFENKADKHMDIVTFADMHASLYPSKPTHQYDHQHSSFSAMSEQLPYQRVRRGVSMPQAQTPFAVDKSCNSSDMMHMSLPPPPPPQQPRLTPTSYSTALNNTGIRMTNLCQRISSRIASMTAEQRRSFILAVLAIDAKTFARTHVARLLADYHIKALHADSDEIWSDISRSSTSSKPIAFLDWLGMPSNEYATVIPSDTSAAARAPPIPNSESVFQYVNHHHRNLPSSSSYNSSSSTYPPARVVEESSSTPWKFDPSLRGNHHDNLAIPYRTIMDEPIMYPSSLSTPAVKHSMNSDDMATLLHHNQDNHHDVDDMEDHVAKQKKADRLHAIYTLQKNRANLASIFRKLLGKDGRLDDNALSCQRLADALLQPPISLSLSPVDAYRLVCDMTNSAYDYDTAFSSTSRIYFRDVLSFLDHQPSTSSPTRSSHQNDSVSAEADTYRHNFIRYSIKNQLYDSLEVQGDRLKLLSLVPRLKSRHRSLLAKGRQATSWETTIPDLCSLLHLKELLHSIDVKVDNEEVKFLMSEVRNRNRTSYAEDGIGDYGVKLGDAIFVLSEIIE